MHDPLLDLCRDFYPSPADRRPDTKTPDAYACLLCPPARDAVLQWLPQALCASCRNLIGAYLFLRLLLFLLHVAKWICNWLQIDHDHESVSQRDSIKDVRTLE